MKTKRKKRAQRTKRRGRLERGLLLQADTATVEVDDPCATGPNAKITVLRQVRSDPLGRLQAHRQIDEAQYRAGRAYQRDWETAGRGVRAIDLTREMVDGSPVAVSVGDAALRARKRLIALESVLGRTMHRVTQAVLVDGMSFETMAAHLFNRDGEAAAKYYGRLFRDALDVLAVEYRLANRSAAHAAPRSQS